MEERTLFSRCSGPVATAIAQIGRRIVHVPSHNDPVPNGRPRGRQLWLIGSPKLGAPFSTALLVLYSIPEAPKGTPLAGRTEAFAYEITRRQCSRFELLYQPCGAKYRRLFDSHFSRVIFGRRL
jgi:hypothetical protein